MSIMTDLALPTQPLCPSWCQLPPGHDSDDPDMRDPESRYVCHRAVLGPRLEVEQLVTLGGSEAGDGPVTAGDGVREYDVEQLRTLAAAYSAAADLLVSAGAR